MNELQVSGESIKAELLPRLSEHAVISLPETASFARSDLRFTDYERPTYLVAVSPATEEDVIQTVKYGREKGIAFSPRAGHHCVTTTMRHLQNGILIDMRSLKKLEIKPGLNQVIVGGGVITDDLVRFLQSKGMEVNVGSCPTTGVMGVTFGAGLGRLQGKYGLLQDNLLSCRLVLADGRLVDVSKTQNPDLFWAIRGAGHNFGIAVEATFKVYPQAHGGIHYSWDLEFHLDQCSEAFKVLNDLHASMPADLAVFVLWNRQSVSGHEHLILFNLVWSGEASAADYWVEKFLSISPLVNSGRIQVTWGELPWTTYNGMNQLLSKPEVWSKAPFKMMGAVSVESFDIPTTVEFFHTLKTMNEKWKGRGLFGAMFECLPHHRVRDLPADTTAFPWRWGTNHFLMMTATPFKMEDRAEFEGHLDEWKRRFINVSGYGRLQQYVNYGNTTSTMQDPLEAMYGYEPWRLEKLRALKMQWDPDNVFRWYQPLIQ